MSFTNHHYQPVTECLIDGNRIKYDACGEDRRSSQVYYQDIANRTNKKLIYIGESNILYFDGVRNEYKHIMHFYQFKNQ